MRYIFVYLTILTFTFLLSGCDTQGIGNHDNRSNADLIKSYSGKQSKESILENIKSDKTVINNIRGNEFDIRRIDLSDKLNYENSVNKPKVNSSTRDILGYSLISTSDTKYGRSVQFQSISQAENGGWNSGFTWIKNRMNIIISSTDTNISVSDRKTGSVFNQIYYHTFSVDYHLSGETTTCSLDTTHTGYFYGSYNAYSGASTSC